MVLWPRRLQHSVPYQVRSPKRCEGKQWHRCGKSWSASAEMLCAFIYLFHGCVWCTIKSRCSLHRRRSDSFLCGWKYQVFNPSNTQIKVPKGCRYVHRPFRCGHRLCAATPLRGHHPTIVYMLHDTSIYSQPKWYPRIVTLSLALHMHTNSFQCLLTIFLIVQV
jgi:hypothetical protein